MPDPGIIFIWPAEPFRHFSQSLRAATSPANLPLLDLPPSLSLIHLRASPYAHLSAFGHFVLTFPDTRAIQACLFHVPVSPNIDDFPKIRSAIKFATSLETSFLTPVSAVQQLQSILDKDDNTAWETLELSTTLLTMQDVVFCPRCSTVCIEVLMHGPVLWLSYSNLNRPCPTLTIAPMVKFGV